MLAVVYAVRWLSVCPKPEAGDGLSQKRRRETESAMRGALGLVLIAAMMVPFPSLAADGDRLNEYRAKAAFLAAFPNFIEWPPDAFPSQQAPIVLCVFGDFSFGTSLAELTRGTSIRGRAVEVRWIRKEQELRSCQILFVSRSEAKRYGKIFKALEGASVLTVGETPDFLASGGAIGFLVEQDRLQFEVSVVAATDAHLRISSNMLALARHVITGTEQKRVGLAQAGSDWPANKWKKSIAGVQP